MRLVWSHVKLNMMNEIFHFLKFQEFISKLRETCFPFKKWNFEPIRNFPHNTDVFTLENALVILFPIYLQMLIMQTSTQTANHKYRKSLSIFYAK